MSLHVPAECRHFLVTYSREEAFAPHARSILARLGYAIWTEKEYDEIRGALDSSTGADIDIEMRIVDEHRLRDLSRADDAGDVPITLLTSRRGIRSEDPRVVAAVKRPAGLHDLYRVLPQFFEERPRSTPRVPTHLRARCDQNGRRFGAAVVSLSESGCLLRSSEPVLLGSTLKLSFHLPRVGDVEVVAESAYQMVPDLGLVFSATPVHVREAIECYVKEALAPA